MQAVNFEAPHMAVGLDESTPRNMKFGALSGGYSARYIRKTGIASGPGYTSWQSALGSGVQVDDMFGGRNAFLKTLWGKSGTKVYQNLNNQNLAYDIGMSVTAAERQAFLEARNGDILTFNQTDSPTRIATAKLTVVVTDLTTGTMIVGTGYIDKFAVSGTVYVRGVAYTYSGVSATALTGLGGGPLPAGGLAVDDLITQVTTPTSFAAAKGTCGMFLEGSTLIAGVKGREDVIYIGAPATFDNPEYAYDFANNGASAKVMENPVVGMIKGNNLGYILGHNWVQSTTGFDVDTGVLVTNPVSDTYGIYNSRCVVNMGGRVAFLGEGRLIPLDLVLNTAGVSQGKPDEGFDLPIRPWLAQFDPAVDQRNVALLEYDIARSWLSITGSINGVARTRIFDTNEGVKAFTPEDIRPMRCHAYYDGQSYFGSNSTDKVFLNYTGLTNNGFPILHRFTSGIMEAKRTGQEVLSKVLRFDGFMSANALFTLNVYLDGVTMPAYTIDLTDSLITSTIGVAIGTRCPGINLIGGGDETVNLAYPFVAEIDLNGLSGQQWKLEWECSSLAAYLEIDSFILEGDGTRFTSNDRA